MRIVFSLYRSWIPELSRDSVVTAVVSTPSKNIRGGAKFDALPAPTRVWTLGGDLDILPQTAVGCATECIPSTLHLLSGFE